MIQSSSFEIKIFTERERDFQISKEAVKRENEKSTERERDTERYKERVEIVQY